MLTLNHACAGDINYTNWVKPSRGQCGYAYFTPCFGDPLFPNPGTVSVVNGPAYVH